MRWRMPVEAGKSKVACSTNCVKSAVMTANTPSSCSMAGCRPLAHPKPPNISSSTLCDALVEIQDGAGDGVPGGEFSDGETFGKLEVSGEVVRGFGVGLGGLELRFP